MKKCIWLFNPHCWHMVEGTGRKMKRHGSLLNSKNLADMYVDDQNYVKIVGLQKCCKCGNIKKCYVEFECDKDLMTWPDIDDKPL